MFELFQISIGAIPTGTGYEGKFYMQKMHITHIYASWKEVTAFS